MAHLRKNEKLLDHARAMIEGKSLAKTVQLCGVHPKTAFRWRHRLLRAPSGDKPRTGDSGTRRGPRSAMSTDPIREPSSPASIAPLTLR